MIRIRIFFIWLERWGGKKVMSDERGYVFSFVLDAIRLGVSCVVVFIEWDEWWHNYKVTKLLRRLGHGLPLSNGVPFFVETFANGDKRSRVVLVFHHAKVIEVIHSANIAIVFPCSLSLVTQDISIVTSVFQDLKCAQLIKALYASFVILRIGKKDRI